MFLFCWPSMNCWTSSSCMYIRSVLNCASIFSSFPMPKGSAACIISVFSYASVYVSSRFGRPSCMDTVGSLHIKTPEILPFMNWCTMSSNEWSLPLLRGVKTYFRSTCLPFLFNVFQVRYSPCLLHKDKYTPYKDENYFSFIVKFSFISRSSVLIPSLYCRSPSLNPNLMQNIYDSFTVGVRL